MQMEQCIHIVELHIKKDLASNQTLILYGISFLVIFLCLAALYESWSVPFSVLLVVPLGVLELF